MHTATLDRLLRVRINVPEDCLHIEAGGLMSRNAGFLQLDFLYVSVLIKVNSSCVQNVLVKLTYLPHPVNESMHCKSCKEGFYSMLG